MSTYKRLRNAPEIMSPATLLRGARGACAFVLLMPAALHGQSTPYQSGQRNAVGSGPGQSPLAMGLVFEPRVDGAIQYANNINLAQGGAEQVDASGLEISPGLYATYNSDRFRGGIDYSLITRAWDTGDFDDLSQRLAANGRYTAIPELFYIDAQAGYSDVVIDAAQGLDYGNLGIFGQGNLSEQAAASISPTLRKKFNALEFVASYSYGRVWYLDVGKGQAPTVGFGIQSDSVDQGANVSLGTARDDTKLSGRVFYEWQKSEFDFALPYVYERAGLDGGFELSRTLTLVGDVGKQSDLDANTTEGGLDSNFWSAGLRWRPSDNTSIEGRVGKQFFGQSYSLTASHRARLLEFTASYSEAPQVETRRFSLGSFDPGQLPPVVDPDLGFGALSSSPFVSKSARVGVTVKGSKTTLNLNVFQSTRDYLRGFRSDEEGNGVSLGATRALASNASLDFTASYSDFQRSARPVGPVPGLAASHDYDTQLLLRGNRDLGPRVTVSLESGYVMRTGTSDYDAWWVGLRGRWTPNTR